MKIKTCYFLFLPVVAAGFLIGCRQSEKKPDIVIILDDNGGCAEELDMGSLGLKVECPLEKGW